MAVKKLLFYKIKTFFNFGVSLCFLQIMGLFVASSYSTGTGHSSGAFVISSTILQYTSIVPFLYSAMWLGVLAFILTLRKSFQYDFVFVTNRRLTGLANILLISMSAVYCGLTVVLSNVGYRLNRYFMNYHQISPIGFKPSFTEILLSVAVTVLYLLLVGALSYFIGSLISKNLIIGVGLPALTVFMAFRNMLTPVVLFFINESSLPLFASKCLTAVLILFGAGLLLSNERGVF